jgi:hypothetical protein
MYFFVSAGFLFLFIQLNLYISVSYEPPFYRGYVTRGGRIQPRVHVSHVNITAQRKLARAAFPSPLLHGVTFVILPAVLYWCECGVSHNM